MNPNISGFGVIGPGFLNRVLYYVTVVCSRGTASGRAATGGIAELVEVQRSTAGRVEAKAPRGHLQRAPVNFGLRGGEHSGLCHRAILPCAETDEVLLGWETA